MGVDGLEQRRLLGRSEDFRSQVCTGPPVFSGPPRALTGISSVVVLNARRIEISGYYIDLKISGVAFKSVRWDSTIPVFFVLERSDKNEAITIESTDAGSRVYVWSDGQFT